MMYIEDPAEIAAIATEFISNLDNLPQEVSHLVKEIEHKDVKIQDLMPKIAAREAQLRELLQKSGSGLANPAGNLSEADRVKADKLAEKIRTDYGRADEWGSQKEALSLRLWRSIHAHHKHLKEEMAKISPSVLNNYASTASIGTPQVPSLSGLPAALAGLKSPAVELDSPLAGLKRKGSLLSPGVGTLTPGTPMSAAARARAGGRTTPGEGSPAPPERGLGSSIRGVGGGRKARGGSLSVSGPGRSALSQSTEFGSLGGLEGFEGEGGEGEEGEEKDDTPYCFCQRVSFGEMIGCDNAENDPDCKEWFHIGCVGVTKPLPQKWYCSECLAKLKNKRRRQ
ncbi:chromatin modification-related protein YNG2 [Moesziomyces antarcticus]|uniref:Related to YNG2 - component of NuA4 histone acetyltransferase complex n=2 Tax=Pseudozyma antarctica TaxID=84753 RepID=A0A5C3FSL7_PSEA2|nr:chromatin modification-related protein YNG2 [Moesziomyces antarcticus]GAK65572.1 chromatin modification-related protein YNG2 [Moesziomyces antarcticus]SPO46587.1 related to YNG2 - component of NuA4 histone acetyltransferase complex [Moesziomyces antarcticus]